MARAFRTGETADTFLKIAGNDMRAMSELKDVVRLLNPADELFNGINRYAEINALAYRQAAKNGPLSEAFTKRVAERERTTFTWSHTRTEGLASSTRAINLS